MNRPDRTPRIDRTRRRRLERELRELPAPPPPADLLGRIRAEIPENLAAANEPGGGPAPRRPWHRTPLFRMAASIAVVALAATVAWQTLELRPAPEAASAPAPAPQELPRQVPAVAAQDAQPEPKQAVEVGPALQKEAPSQGVVSDRRAEAAAQIGKAEPAPPSLEEARARPVGAVEQAGREVRAATSEAGPAPVPPDRNERDLAALRAPQESARVAMADSMAPSAPTAAQAAGGRAKRAAVAEGEVASRSEAGERTLAAPRLAGRDAVAPSTGGSAEPNDQPVGDMFFRPAGTNPFVDTAEDRLSTFALDVDTGSWSLARAYLERGALPPPEAIRVEELVNAQRYGDPAPRRGEFTLVAEGAPSPFAPAVSNDRYRLVRFAVKAREVVSEERKSAVLTFVVDVSGSMDRENRLGLVKRALGLLLDELRPDDRVALVVYGSQGRVLLGHTRDHEAIRDAIARLVPEGSTNAEEGLRLGYRLAGDAFRRGAINRVILCSDGVANVGATGPESILAAIGEAARRGIELTTVGFGMGNYNDALMERLADQGDGAYHYVDSLEEARRVFVENLTGMLQTVARDAKVQVDFDPASVERWRLLGYENRDVADRDFRNDAVDAGEIGAGHAVTALYEVRLAPGVRSADRLATLRLRWQSVEAGRVVEAEQELHARDLARGFDRASRDLRLAAVAAELAERLKKSYWAKDTSWATLAAVARRLERDFPRDAVVAELADLVRDAARLAGENESPERPGGPLDDEP